MWIVRLPSLIRLENVQYSLCKGRRKMKNRFIYNFSHSFSYFHSLLKSENAENMKNEKCEYVNEHFRSSYTFSNGKQRISRLGNSSSFSPRGGDLVSQALKSINYSFFLRVKRKTRAS
jgi:hypothetical protein